MAGFEHSLTGDADRFITYLDQAILSGSVTAQVEGQTDVRIGDARMLVRVYERFGALGGNRVSLNVSVLAVGEQLSVSAIASGGSTAMFWKVNTVSEESFLQKAINAINDFDR